MFVSGVSGNSRSRSFPRMEASDSLSRTLGMDFFIPFPFPNFGNGFFSFPSRSRILGMGFFHSLPIPEIWEWIFLFPSRSRISGMGFFNSLPVPEFREWAFSIPFPFPNPQKSFPLTPALPCWLVCWYPARHLFTLLLPIMQSMQIAQYPSEHCIFFRAGQRSSSL